MRSPARNLWNFLLLSLLLVGAGLRFTGLTRGSANLVLTGQSVAATSFYRFHPDEELVIRAALTPDLDPLNPPFTVYGLLPVYALRGTLALADLCGWGGTSLEDPDSARRIYYVARTLAVLCSCGVLLLAWRMGCRYFSQPAATLGLAIIAFAPGAIQQAHFFIVDGFFLLLSVAAVQVSLQALESGSRRSYILAGLLIGATAAVRLNGLLLCLVLLAGHLATTGRRDWPSLRRRWCQPEPWLAVGAALLALLLVEPYLVADPQLLWQAEATKDFGLAVKVTRGEILQPWTLVDVHTIPYLDHCRLWPLIAGWPCAFIFLLTPVYILWKQRTLPKALMLAWCSLYFLLIGQLQVRAVRYLMPMLPFMALFAGALLAASWQTARPWMRQGGKLVTALVIGHLAFKGIAFARIYTEEDSRIQAGRWISSQIPKDNQIGVENGAFSMQGFVSGQGYKQVLLDVSTIFYTYPYLSCRTQMGLLGASLQNMEYIALTDANRYAQFRAAPDLFPVVAGLYDRLIAGELGFELAQRFKTYPSLLGHSFADDGAEPSFLGYDHPGVWVFKSKGKAAVGEALARWEQQLADNTCCPDHALEQVAEELGAGNWVKAKSATHSLLTTYPDFAPGYWLLARIHRQLGAPDSASEALIHYQLPGWSSASTAVATDSMAAISSRYQAGNPRVAHILNIGTIHLIPAYTALSLMNLGLDDMALQVLRETVEQRPQYPPQVTQRMAYSYLDIAKLFLARGDSTGMEQIVELSTRIFGVKEAFNILALQAQKRGEPAQALKWWEQSLLLDADQANIHQRAGLVALLDLGLREKARYHLARAVALDPSLQAGIATALRAAGESR